MAKLRTRLLLFISIIDEVCTIQLSVLSVVSLEYFYISLVQNSFTLQSCNLSNFALKRCAVYAIFYYFCFTKPRYR